MNSQEFIHYRKVLDKTQKEMAQLLGVSLKAVHSYEQGWRSIPGHVERQMFFLVSRKNDRDTNLHPCWVIQDCPRERRNNCPAWEFQAGTFCWFINGTICQGKAHKNWQEKMKHCRNCKVLASKL